MAIITISRGTSSGGCQVADCLGKRLGYDVVSREVLTEAARSYGVPESKLADALEKGPGLLDRFLRDRRLYLAIIQAALCERASRDNVIYHGHAGHLLLAGVKHVLRVRLIAPLAFRVKQLVEAEKMSGEEAERYIARVDRERVAWTRNLYGVDWQDPALYDLVLNLERLDMDTACEIIAATAARPQFQADGASRKAMADLLLASRIRAALASDERTSAAEVEVRADDGAVEVQGKLADPVLVEAVLSKARSIGGVKDVRYGTRAMFEAAR